MEELLEMNANLRAGVPIMRPNLPPLEGFAKVVSEIFDSRILSNFGEFSRLLEERASTVLGHAYPQCVSSCDIGLTLAWKALECPPGEVIVPSFTFCSTVNAIRWNGLEPVFADVDPDTYSIDVEDARRLINSRTVAIAAVHVFGAPAAIEPLERLAREHNVKLLFDAAHGLGAEYEGNALGGFGDASIFSLSGTKLVTGGEGGLATFRDPDAAERFSYLRAYGFKGDYNCRHIGLNGKLSELNAALAWLSLDLVAETLNRRHAQVQHYRRQLLDCPSISWQAVPLNSVHGYKDLALEFRTPEQRDAAEKALSAVGIMTKRYFYPVHRMEAHRSFSRRPLPVTDHLYNHLLCVPLFHDLAMDTIDWIARVIRSSLRSTSSLAHHSAA